jgi:hypothetical protein
MISERALQSLVKNKIFWIHCVWLPMELLYYVKRQRENKTNKKNMIPLFPWNVVVFIFLKKNDNGTDPFRISIYTISSTYEQNMSSSGGYHLARSRRKITDSCWICNSLINPLWPTTRRKRAKNSSSTYSWSSRCAYYQIPFWSLKNWHWAE